MGPVGPRWAPCWPHEPCHLGTSETKPLLDINKMLSNTSVASYSVMMLRLVTHPPLDKMATISQTTI